jgi:hypothetical protein
MIKRSKTLLLLCLGALTLASTLSGSAAVANSLIDQAYAAGTIDRETALLYQVYEAVTPSALPAQYLGSAGGVTCGAPAAIAALDAVDESSEEFGQRLAKALQRPILDESLVSPGGHFRIHYAISGRDAVDLTDEDANDIPDYVDRVAAALDSTWILEIDLLGYRQPPSDGGAGGGDEYDVYIIDYGGTNFYGTTTSLAPGATTAPSFLQIDNDYTNPGYGTSSACNGARGARGLDAMRVTVAHEFFHAVQFAYYQTKPHEVWWQESSATWMEEVAYPEVDDYLIYLCSFLLDNSRSLDSGRAGRDNHIYGATVFPHFLDQRYGRQVIRQIWEEHAMWANADLSNFDRVLRTPDYPGGLEDAVGEFGVWNYFTGHRHRPQFYAEGDRWPVITVGPSGTAVETSVTDSGRLDHLTSAYFRMEPNLRAGGVFIDTELGQRTRWQRRLALVNGDTVIVAKSEARDPLQILDWDSYDEVVTVLTNTDFIGLGFDYEIRADYDPQLTDRQAPLALALNSSYPNPLQLGQDSAARLPFDLNLASFNTRLSIFSFDGQLVRLFDLGRRAPGTYQDVSWDGRNQYGDFVGSGIYYYVLEADGNRATKRLAVVRDQ